MFVATKFILALLEAKVEIPEIPATKLIFALSVGVKKVFSK